MFHPRGATRAPEPRNISFTLKYSFHPEKIISPQNQGLFRRDVLRGTGHKASFLAKMVFGTTLRKKRDY